MNVTVDNKYILTCNTIEHNRMSKSKKCRDIVDSSGDNNGVIPRILAELIQRYWYSCCTSDDCILMVPITVM